MNLSWLFLLSSALRLGLFLAAPAASQERNINKNGNGGAVAFSASSTLGEEAAATNDGTSNDRLPLPGHTSHRSRGARRVDNGFVGMDPADRHLAPAPAKVRSCKGMKKGMKGCRTRVPTRRRVPTAAPSTMPTAIGSPSSAPSGRFCDDLCTCATNGHKYRLIQQQLTWHEANASAAKLPKCCGGKTAHLVTIDSDDEDFLVGDLINPFGRDPNVWIGISDLAKDGTFAWVTGENVTYQAWDLNYFDGGQNPNNCGELYVGTYEWYTYKCSYKQHYVVEYDCDLL